MSTDPNDLPVKDRDSFFADAEEMNLDKLKDKTFFVAISSGDRDKSKFISQSIHGPYDFYEMAEEVGVMWREHQLHAKVVLASKDRTARIQTLDANTIDYIEAKFEDIMMDAMLAGAFDDQKKYTCQAGIVEDDGSADQRHKAKEQEEPQEQEDV